jgi:hypothetical protein
MEDRSALNAVTLALIDAGLPMRDFVTACEASYIDGHVLVDPNALEASGSFPHCVVPPVLLSIAIVHGLRGLGLARVWHAAAHAPRHAAPARASQRFG